MLIQVTNSLSYVKVEEYPADPVELFGKIKNIIDAASIDIGDFIDYWTELGEKINSEIYNQQDPIELTREETNFIYGLALLTNITPEVFSDEPIESASE